MKRYNGLVQLEVKKLAGLAEAELVKRQAMLLLRRFAFAVERRSVKVWVCSPAGIKNYPKREREKVALCPCLSPDKCYQPFTHFPQ